MTQLRKAIAATAAIAVFGILGATPTAYADDNALDSGETSAPITYAKDVAPIINAECVSCHRPGQIGPMSLTNYQDVRPWAKSIRNTVVDRSMPPWHADPAYGDFSNERRLTEDQIQTIAAWVDAGSRSGDLSTAPEPDIDTSVVWAIGQPDQVFTMEPHEVADEIEDRYEHFLIPAGFEEDKDIVAVEIRAGDPGMVHHVLVFAMPPGMGGASVFEDAGTALSAEFITGWAPGTDPLRYREGYAKRLKAGHNLLFQVHYHKEPGPGTGGIDQSSLAVKFADSPVSDPTKTAWIMDLELEIPPGEANYESVSLFEFKTDGHILGYAPHMHLRGKNYRFEALYPDGKVETLLDVPRYDFNWQTFYTLSTEKFMPAGTKIRATARFDNSADNPANPDPSQTVYFSEKTTDEMHIGFMEYAYVDKMVKAQKFGFPEGFNLFEFQQRQRERYGDGHHHGRDHQAAGGE